jgi:TolB protein
VTNPDGTGERKVSHAPRGYLDRGPDWSPDGTRIVFRRCSPNYDRCAIWTVKPDGSDETMLSPSCPKATHPGSPLCPDDDSPAYSPNGREVAFTRYAGPRANGLMVADTALRHVRRVFWFGARPGTPDISSPAWSPDGKQIAFVVRNFNGPRYKPVNGIAIYIVNVDGTGLRRLTPWKIRAGAGPEAPDWSPDGSRILFRSQPLVDDDSGGNLYTIRPDGARLRQLTHFSPYPTGPGDLRAGSFSPDGSSILFATTHGAFEDPPGNNAPDVFVMSADGTDVRPVTRTREWDLDPDWGPG